MYKITKRLFAGSGGIRTHASEETGALNQRLRPLGHATLILTKELFFFVKPAPSHEELHIVRVTVFGTTRISRTFVRTVLESHIQYNLLVQLYLYF